MPLPLHTRRTTPALLLIALAAACGPGVAPGVLVRDSAGIAIVTSTAAAVREAPLWRLSDTAQVEVGGAAGRVAAVAWRPDGVVAVAREGDGVRLHGPADGWRGTTVGGPGTVDWLAADAGDSVLARDPATGGVAVVDGAGRVTRRFALRGGGTPVGLFGDGTLLVRGPGAAAADSASYLRVNRTGVPLDTLATLPHAAPVVAQGPGFWYAAGDRSSVERLSPRGVRVRSVRWDGPGVAALLPGADGELWVRPPSAPGADSVTWLVLREDGRIRARIPLPERTRVLAVARDSVLVAEPDADEGERVRLRAIRRP